MTCAKCGSKVDQLDACPVCMLQEESPPLLGGALLLEEEIGRGGMGTVYRARHVRLGRTVAVKFLPSDLANQKEFEARFEREARALARLNHPNIVGIHDFGRDDGVSFLVMEYVEGKPLTDQLPLSVSRAAEIAAQICDALSYAHRQGIVHRDIKPDNLLMDGSGRVKIADFGIARIVGPDARGWTVTSKDETVGTPHYIAPEALTGAAPDPRMDIYSLGVVLYQMLTGKLPVGNFASAPPPFDRIVRKALAPEPAARYSTADEMKRDLLSASNHASELNADEQTWIRAVAMLQSISTAVALWAFLESVTPKLFKERPTAPLIELGRRVLSDGQIVSMARFEMWWTIAALATFAFALTGYGLLRRHWRLSGLEEIAPAKPIATVNWVVVWGIVSMSAYGLRKLLEAFELKQLVVYFPVIGALILIMALFNLWICILSAWRISKPVTRMYLMWAGFWLAVLPPIIEFILYVRDWKPIQG